jgi:tight adherence protein B
VRRVALLVALAALALVPAASGAGSVEVRHVDAQSYPAMSVTVTAPPNRAPALRENGHKVVGLKAENLGRRKSVVIAIDRSRSMKGASIEHALAAARAFVRGKARADRVAVVAFGEKATALTGFSGATIDADIALRNLGIDRAQGTALNDAVVVSSRMLGDEASLGRVLVLVTDGKDVSSVAPEAQALAEARKAGVTVFTVGIASDQFSPASLQRLADETGGTYRDAATSADLGAVLHSIASELQRTWRLTYLTASRPGDRIELQTWSGNAGRATASLVVPGPKADAPGPKPSSLLPAAAYSSKWGELGLALVVGVLVLLALTFVAAVRRSAWLQSRLAPHVTPNVRARAKAQERERFAMGSSLLAVTEKSFGHLKWWTKVHRMLERGDVPLRTAEFLYIAVGCSFLVAIVVTIAGLNPLFVLAGFAAGAALPFGYLKMKISRRLKAFENQLPDILLTLAASLKAGHSFKQGLQTVVDEGQPPASKEFSRVLAETQLGRPMDDALAEMANRVASKNLRFVLNAVTIQSQVGGSLAGLFDMVAETVRQRQQFARKIKGLTAMGRASAYVLVALPFVLALVITIINPEFMSPLYHTSTGQMLIFMALGLMTLGSLVLKKIVSFKG